MKADRLLLIDGMALLFRAYYATAVTNQFMYNSDGMPTNAVQGYMRHLLTAVEKMKPSHIAVCWDMGSKTFRNDIYEDYKSNRKAPPEQLIPQFDFAKRVTDAFGIPNIGVQGYEADDCIGTMAHELKGTVKMTILTGDRDLLQLLDDEIDVWIMQKGIGNYEIYTKQYFIDQFRLEPNQLIDVKALMGDPSDGYPGVKGIGEKTATKLIQTYGNLETMIANIAKLTPFQQKQIKVNYELMKISRMLARINYEVPLTFELKQAIWGGIPQSAFKIIYEQELKIIEKSIESV